jgi:hypothetical protein
MLLRLQSVSHVYTTGAVALVTMDAHGRRHPFKDISATNSTAKSLTVAAAVATVSEVLAVSTSEQGFLLAVLKGLQWGAPGGDGYAGVLQPFSSTCHITF